MAKEILNWLVPRHVIMDLPSGKHLDAIRQVALTLSGDPLVKDIETLIAAVLEREKLESTCMGNGIAFPHARTDAVKDLVAAVGRSREGVLLENCGQTIHLFFVIVAPKHMSKEYLIAVGALARSLKTAETRNRLIDANTAEEFLEILTQQN